MIGSVAFLVQHRNPNSIVLLFLCGNKDRGSTGWCDYKRRQDAVDIGGIFITYSHEFLQVSFVMCCDLHYCFIYV